MKHTLHITDQVNVIRKLSDEHIPKDGSKHNQQEKTSKTSVTSGADSIQLSIKFLRLPINYF